MDFIRSKSSDLIKTIKILIEVVGWLAIAGGTTLGAGLISIVIYTQWENKTIALAILIIGFIIGAIWATRISIKYGTIEWLSGIRRIS
jgi:glucose uptake protein GlcU